MWNENTGCHGYDNHAIKMNLYCFLVFNDKQQQKKNDINKNKINTNKK